MPYFDVPITVTIMADDADKAFITACKHVSPRISDVGGVLYVLSVGEPLEVEVEDEAM